MTRYDFTQADTLRRAVGFLLLLAAGCGQPQLGTENFRLVESLRTAVSARRTDWLEDNARQIARRHEAGQLDDDQFAALNAVVEKARAGEWEAAEAAVLELAKGQRREGT
jgi:hypothetical protein